jgi:hypothetical protein
MLCGHHIGDPDPSSGEIDMVALCSHRLAWTKTAVGHHGHDRRGTQATARVAPQAVVSEQNLSQMLSLFGRQRPWSADRISGQWVEQSDEVALWQQTSLSGMVQTSREDRSGAMDLHVWMPLASHLIDPQRERRHIKFS